MINASFLNEDSLIVGFKVTGHANFDDFGLDIVCASVSSCAIMAANTITEIIKADAGVKTSDGMITLKISNGAELCQPILKGLLLHLTEIAKEYPDNLTIYNERNEHS